jgi:hypothetical protein
MTTVLRQTTLDIQTCRLKDHGRQRPEDRSRWILRNGGYARCIVLRSRLRVANSTNDGFGQIVLTKPLAHSGCDGHQVRTI